MPERIAHVLVPEPHHLGLAGPEWAWHGVCGDTLRLVGLPADDDAPASVALYVVEATDPGCDATAYLTPDMARDIAGAWVAAAENAESGDQP